ncbi:hypothetical protein EYF80_067173 [Liparis tanakae]|uniref:Uncharacterized protein n=1 Tax=Liparis tanakae TaxID=230148 RepID=A0A4Z2E2V7_9TELE|nr:hypothetical protein EYF80_067173 [Liparis tanakae]
MTNAWQQQLHDQRMAAASRPTHGSSFTTDAWQQLHDRRMAAASPPTHGSSLQSNQGIPKGQLYPDLINKQNLSPPDWIIKPSGFPSALQMFQKEPGFPELFFENEWLLMRMCDGLEPCSSLWSDPSYDPRVR